MAGMHGRSPLLRLQSDERLIAMVRRGNHHAFEALVARYQARLLAFCRHMLSSKEDAEDVLQEVFAAAFNAVLADDRPINVRPWLYRIARNRSLNHLRRTQAVGVDSMDIHLSENGQTTADKVHRREEFRLLIADVQELPETQRTALLLREIDALSYEQIAEAMETTVPSVKSLLVRARVSLAEAAEARLLSCEEVRNELGEVAEGLRRTSAPVRRHMRTCERCATFRKQLRQTNKALAAIFPVAPLLLLKKTFLAQLGTSAAASGGSAAASGGAAAAAGGAMQAGISTLATKTVAGLAAAAIVTAGAVEVKHVTRQPRDKTAATVAAVAPPAAPAPAAAAPVAQVESEPRSSGDAYKPDRKRAEKKADAEKPKATATATPTPTPGETTNEQHDSATTELPSETTGSTEEGDGVIAAPAEPTPGPVVTTTQPSPPPSSSPQPAPTPTPTGPAPTPTPQPTPTPEPTPEPTPAPTPES
ncbi:MAG TPA: RNA polymerase sigma factor [Solirubrobacteraceae bacterium]|nr:RNA polymerase sigma factor [Solirubrobacteraceae bacterium]